MLHSERTILALIIAPLILSFVASAQTEPCSTESAAHELSGRPTLKRHKPAYEYSNSPSHGEAWILTKDSDCPDQDIQASTAKHLDIRFEGLNTFQATDVLKYFRDRQIIFANDRMPSAQLLGKAMLALKDFLNQKGFLVATVDLTQDEVMKTVTFLVSEGPRAQISEIRFQGNKVFSSQELVSRIREYLSDYDPPEKSYDAELFDLAKHRLTNFMRSRGYLKATAAEPTTEIGESGVVLTVSVHEGPLYRLGQVEIEGAEHIPTKQIREMLRLRRGDIANGELIGRWLFEDLKKVYGEMGFIQYTAEPEPEFKEIAGGETEGTVDFKVNIDEGSQFKVQSIKILVNDILKSDLCELLLIRDGDIFDQRRFEESLARLSGLGSFDEIDKDKDAEFKTDEETSQINIVIRLSNKGLENKGNRQR